MAGERIFIVEDESIVAEDLKRMLERLGFIVLGTASNGNEAIQKIEATKPDMVLMDIRIQGSLDGVDVAEHVTAQFDIPVIYLTAYADEITIERAKGTMPAGYILKPFEERGLKTTIELALYRHHMNLLANNVEDWHGGILENLSSAVLAIDPDRNVVYMNKLAEKLTGFVFEKIMGKSIEKIFKVKKSGDIGLPSEVFIERDGRECSLDLRESPIKDLDGKVTGTALVLKEISD